MTESLRCRLLCCRLLLWCLLSLRCLALSSSRRLFGLGRSLTGGTAGLRLVAIATCPERQVVAEKLHDERAVPVGLLGKRVELRDGVVEGLLGKVAGAIGRVQDLVVEDGEVKGKT